MTNQRTRSIQANPSSPRASWLAIAAAGAMLAACASDGGDVEVEPPGDTDPAGVRFADYGISELPCGPNLHLATVVTASRGYHAFCADEQGNTSVLVVSPQSTDVDMGKKSPLEIFLAITPSNVAIPALLGSGASGRQLTSDVVAFIHPDARASVQKFRADLVAASSCSSQATFESSHCSSIEDWIDDPGFNQTSSWCSSGLLTGGDAQRTSSAQGVTFPWEGRLRVVACNADVLVRRYYKNPFTNAWWNASNHTLKPGFFLAWVVSANDATWCPGGLDPCQHASDLRFRVEPTAGASYRYTGGFMNFPPVP